MRANFYKVKYGNYRNSELLISKDIDCVPQSAIVIIFSGQKFCIDYIEFNLDKNEFDIYITRV